MNPENMAKKQAIKEIKLTSEYEELKRKFKLSKEEKEIMDMVFVEEWNYNLIADTIGCSECTVKRKMRKILDLL